MRIQEKRLSSEKNSYKTVVRWKNDYRTRKTIMDGCFAGKTITLNPDHSFGKGVVSVCQISATINGLKIRTP